MPSPRNVRRTIERGADVEGVARRFGLTLRFVEGRLRLASLAPVIAHPPCGRVKPAVTEVERLLAALLAQSPHAERVPGATDWEQRPD